MNVTEAIVHKLAWKSPVLDRYANGLLLAALELRRRGRQYFNNDDVPEMYQPHDKTTVGVVFKLLMNERVITRFHVTIADKNIFGGMRASTRLGNNGHRNQLYELTNESIAREWLERHGATPPPKPAEQQELFATNFANGANAETTNALRAGL